jgi:hypothetical protein
MPGKPTSTVAKARARHAALTRHRSPDDPAVVESRQALTLVNAEDYVRRLVDQAPPLTDDQRRRLAAILTGGGDR